MEESLKRLLRNSYSPYSNFKVSAIVDTDIGEFAGVNIENSSFGATICAERNAIFNAISNGAKNFNKLSIDYLYKESNAKVDGTIKITNKEISESKNEGSIELSINYDKYKVNLDLDYKSEIGASIANFDETNTVKLSEMTPTEIDNLYAKLFNKLIKSNMYEIIKNISYDFPSLY